MQHNKLEHFALSFTSFILLGCSCIAKFLFFFYYSYHRIACHHHHLLFFCCCWNQIIAPNVANEWLKPFSIYFILRVYCIFDSNLTVDGLLFKLDFCIHADFPMYEGEMNTIYGYVLNLLSSVTVKPFRRLTNTLTR